MGVHSPATQRLRRAHRAERLRHRRRLAYRQAMGDGFVQVARAVLGDGASFAPVHHVLARRNCQADVLTPENADPQTPRYEPYGIAITKRRAYRKGCRPVLYLSNAEVAALGIPRDELWRIVRFEERRDSWISWMHEREWRYKGGFQLPRMIQAAFVRNTSEALGTALARPRNGFACVPRSIIPLTVLCQGLMC